jgi:hypothetical protein
VTAQRRVPIEELMLGDDEGSCALVLRKSLLTWEDVACQGSQLIKWKGIRGMRVSHALAEVSAVFDDPSLVSCAGLAPVLALAQRCGLAELVGSKLTLTAKGGVNAPGSPLLQSTDWSLHSAGPKWKRAEQVQLCFRSGGVLRTWPVRVL